MTSGLFRAMAMVFGIVAMLLCLNAPAQAATPAGEQPAVTLMDMPGHMPCCPDTPAGQQRTCAAQCPVVPSVEFTLAPHLSSHRLDFDVAATLRDGVQPGLDLPPPR